MSKIISIKFGTNYSKVEHGHEPQTYIFKSDAIIDIVGSYGIPGGGGDCKQKRYNVEVPDWVEHSANWSWDMARTGYRSKSGTDDMCFVICERPITKEVKYFGEADQFAMIDEAVNGGLLFVYPEKDGSMTKIPVNLA